MGGLIYFSFLLVITIILLNCLPCINLIFQLLFDSCVACASNLGNDGSTPKRKSILGRASSSGARRRRRRPRRAGADERRPAAPAG